MVDRWLVETESNTRFDFYTRANIGEVFPDPVAPLSFNWFENPDGIGGSEQGFRDAYIKIGAIAADELPPDKAVFLGVKGGYGYLNASALRLLGHRAPGMTHADIDNAFFGDAPGVPDFVAQPGDDRPDLTAAIGATFQWALTTPDLPEVAADEKAMNELRQNRPDLGSLSDRELVAYVWSLMDTHFRRLFGQHIYISFLATLPVGIITKVTEAVGQPEAALKLLAGIGDVESAAPSMVMWDLGRRVAASPGLSSEFDNGVSGLHARLAASNDPATVEFLTEFDQFLVAYGSRGPNEWETRSPTWETDPDLALAAIDRMRLADESSDPRSQNQDRSSERIAIGNAITEALAADPETQGQFKAALHSATVFMPGRERTKTNCVKLIQEVRVALREWGKRCVAAGTFPEVNSYGLLTKEEMYAFLDSPDGFVEKLAEREQLMKEVSAIQEPFLFVGQPPPMNTYPKRSESKVAAASDGDTVQGMPGCPGSAVGIARVLSSPHDPGALNPGEILVAPITDPSWTPLFVPASAVVVDVGAPLSHAIIVSRELGIPCVVSATDATRRIPDGARIEVDGNTGVVTILSTSG